jgi:hypothetical protein
LVHFPVTGTPVRPGALVEVDITHGAPYHLLGECVSVLREPKHKRRIPVVAS